MCLFNICHILYYYRQNYINLIESLLHPPEQEVAVALVANHRGKSQEEEEEAEGALF